MNKQSELRDQRLKLYWYLGLIALPVFVALLLLNADPYEQVQLNQVIELRKQLAEREAGAEVVAWLDAKGGHNLTDGQWQSVQEVNAEQLYFMLNSSQHNAELKAKMKQALADSYVTQAEYQGYLQLARTALMDRLTLAQYGY
jgi:hypothetical protein